MILTRGQYDQHWNECGDHETEIDLEIRGQDEPAITMALFEFAGRLCGPDRAGRATQLSVGGTDLRK